MSIQAEGGFTAADLAPDLGDRLRKSLRVSGISVQEMAEYLEVERSTPGRWMAGHNAPSAAALRLWALRTGVPFTWLRDGTLPVSDDGPSGVWCPEQDSNLQPTVLRPSVPAWQGSAA